MFLKIIQVMDFDPGALEISSPSVVFDDSTYHLWYSNVRSIKIGIVEAPLGCIGYATSPDGINWTLVDTTLFAPTLDNSHFYQIHASQGRVIADNDTFKIWYWGYNPNYGELGMNSFGYAWSTDGRSWTKVQGPGMFGSVYDQVMDGNLEGIGLATPCVVKDGDMYHLFLPMESTGQMYMAQEHRVRSWIEVLLAVSMILLLPGQQ